MLVTSRLGNRVTGTDRMKLPSWLGLELSGRPLRDWRGWGRSSSG